MGKTLGAATIAALQAFILFILAPLIGVTIGFAVIPELLVFMILIAFAISGMGLFIASLMKTTESFGLLMQVLIFPMFFISGAFFPLTAVPLWMSWLSKINPLTYGVDALRQIILNHQVASEVLAKISLHSATVNGLFLTGFAVFMVGAAVIAFNKKG